eukprot:COSAG01_NODE_42007_length_444_cov_2.765217_1_plen_52_part_00
MVFDIGYHIYFAVVSNSQPKKKQRLEDEGGPVGQSTFGVSFTSTIAVVCKS